VRRALLFLVLAPALAAADGKLDTAVANARRRAVRRLAHWAVQAEAAHLHASAAVAWRRIVRLDPDHIQARQKLGYERALGRWTRSAEAREAARARTDSDAVLAKQYRANLALLEEEYLVDLVRVCGRFGTPEERAKIVLPLLERLPRRADLHEVLGHKRVGDGWVRPELEAMVRAIPSRLAAWRAFGNQRIVTEPVPDAPAVPGVDGLRCVRTDEQVIGATGDPQPLAVEVGRVQALLVHLLGPDAPRWRASPMLFLDPDAYKALLKKLHPEPAEFRFMHRYANYEHADFYAVRLHRPADAGERVGHTAGYLTMLAMVAPPERWSQAPYAWLLEGFAYLVTFELYGAGNVSFVSLEESSAKAGFTRPPPAKRTREACLRWVADQMLARRGYPLENLFARSLNNLDPCAALQAYSFVRFLFLRDPAAAARLPGLLAKEQTGPQPARVDRALRAATGAGTKELERLWRAFMLETDLTWGY
jgi:hypothetical protein